MVDKTPAQITPGTANDDSVVHASDASLADLSRSHTERDISRLQGDAPLFQVSQTYIINDLVTQNDIVYRNIVAIPVAGAFDATDWEPVGTPDRFTSGTASDSSTVFASEDDDPTTPAKHTERDISRLQAAIFPYSSLKTYNVGDLTEDSGLLWFCDVAVVVPEAFDINNWRLVSDAFGIMLQSYNTDPAGNNEFFALQGAQTGTGVEANAQAPIPFTISLRLYSLQVSSNNTVNPFVFVIRKNGADGNGIITVPAGTTGFFQDTTNVDDFVGGDLVCYQYREGGGAGVGTLLGSSCITLRTET